MGFLPLLIDISEDRQERGRERRGERHAAKVVMNGIRTRDTLSGRSLLCGMHPDHLASGRPDITS